MFSPLVMDARVTVLRRVLRGEKIWRAHRDHYYQRLVRLGWGHHRTAIAEYIPMIGCAVTALTALRLSSVKQVALLIGCATAQAVLMLLWDRAWRQRHQEGT